MSPAAPTRMIDDVRIEPYDPSDLDALMEIENVSFTAPWSRASYEELAPMESIGIWIARVGRQMAGYMLLQRVEEEMELHTFAVRQDLRRQGIGMRLMDHMLAEARNLGVKRIFLQVRPTNAAARALYERLGFKSVGTRHAYYKDNNEDAIVMRLSIDEFGH